MKKKLAIIGFVLASVLVLWWLPHRRLGPSVFPPASISANANQPTPPPASRQVQTSATIAVATSPAPTQESDFMARNGKRLKQMKDDAEQAQAEWQTPIEFYGEVVDENTNPVSGAQVDFDANDTSAEGTSFYHTQSDANGLFSIKNIQGKILGVKVNKEGYYSYAPAVGRVFWYAGANENFVPDSLNPVVFWLRKKGVGDSLIEIKRNYKILRDGTPVGIDLATGKATTGGSGNLVVQCWTDDQGKPPGQKYDWHCVVTIPGGGLVLSDEVFPFLAPEIGYVSTNQIARPADQPGWKSDVDIKFYYQLSDGRYGRMKFSMIAGGDHFCMIDSFFNPSGSRNLEPSN
jgi:hypothetical protein